MAKCLRQTKLELIGTILTCFLIAQSPVLLPLLSRSMRPPIAQRGALRIISFNVIVSALHKLTLNILHTLVKDLLENLGVLQFLLNLGNNGISEFALLPLLDTLLVSYPRVENSLGFGCDGGLLLELVGVSLKLSGFLIFVRSPPSASYFY